MCIRDRVESTKRLGAEVELVKGTYDDAHDRAVELQEQTGMTFIPVSYTHLDVYKRQVPARGDPRQRAGHRHEVRRLGRPVRHLSLIHI